MPEDFWMRQASGKPLFPDILWSRPETRQASGKLLIIGGNAHGFSAVGEAYNQADKSGAGSIRILLPECLRKSIGMTLEHAEYADCTPSGSFSQKALGEFLAQAAWSDAVLLVGDIGKNSETSILLDKFVEKYTGPLVIARDAVDYFYSNSSKLAARPHTTLVVNLSQLQKLGSALKFETPFLLGMGMVLLAQALSDFTKQHKITVVTKELDNLVVAHNGRVSSTKTSSPDDYWRAVTSAKASVFWMQNSSKPFESITSSLV